MLTRSALTIRLHPNDDVVIARQQLVGGTQLLDEKVTISGLVPPGHKVATRPSARTMPLNVADGTMNCVGLASTPNA